MAYVTLLLSFFWFRDKAVHLLTIDGYLCHKVHKAVKVFCEPFDKYLEDLWREIHNDIKLNADIKTALKDLCFLLGLHYSKPSEPVKYRWLPVYRTTVTHYLWMMHCLYCVTLG